MPSVKHFRTMSDVNFIYERELYEIIDECPLVIKEESLVDFIDFPRGKSIVAVEDNNNHICSIAMLTEEYEHRLLNINIVYTAEDSRRQGYGTYLLEYINQYAKLQELTKSNLVVFLDNYQARALYEKSGFMYDNKGNKNVLSIMTRYTSQFTNQVAGVSYEMLRLYGADYYKMLPTMKYSTEYYNLFGRHLSQGRITNSEKNNTIKKLLVKPDMLNTAIFIKEMAMAGDDMDIATTIKYHINMLARDDIPEDVLNDYKLTLSLTDEQILRICDITECMQTKYREDEFFKGKTSGDIYPIEIKGKLNISNNDIIHSEKSTKFINTSTFDDEGM